MKILFLDIDGVLNSMDNEYSRLYLWKLGLEKSRDEYGDLFDERCVRWLKYIIDKTGCKIVISSTWRKSGLLAMQDMWKYRKLPGEVIDITPLTVDSKLFTKYYSEIADRGYEIQQWLEENDEYIYCIVDDEYDMLEHQNFVQTNKKFGLDYQSAKDIIRILNTTKV